MSLGSDAGTLRDGIHATNVEDWDSGYGAKGKR